MYCNMNIKIKKFNLTLLLLSIVWAFPSNAQTSKNNQAKAYYFAAEASYKNKEFNDALLALEKVESLLGKSNAVLSALKVKVYFEQKEFAKAKNEIGVFFGFKASDILTREISSYLIDVDKGLAKEKELLTNKQVINPPVSKSIIKPSQEIVNIKNNTPVKNNINKQTVTTSQKNDPVVENNIEEDNITKFIGKLAYIPKGVFRMGDINGGGELNEKPSHEVNMKSFKMMTKEVTFAQWDDCVEKGGCSYRPSSAGWGRGKRPVINVSYNDIIHQFIPWLNEMTHKKFHLPTEAQWEYAARADSKSKFNLGNSIDCSTVRFADCTQYKKTAEVGSYIANTWGLYDMHGNVWEWTKDCFNDTYIDAPTDGSAWTKGDCKKRTLRGGSWSNRSPILRLSNRSWDTSSRRYNDIGFRLVLNE